MELLLSIHHAAMGEYIEATWGPWDDDVQRSTGTNGSGEGCCRSSSLADQLLACWR